MTAREEAEAQAQRTLINYSRARSGGASDVEIRSLARALAADLQALLAVLSVPETESEQVFLEGYTIGHAKFGGLGGDVARAVITREAWADLGQPEVLEVSVSVPVEEDPE